MYNKDDWLYRQTCINDKRQDLCKSHKKTHRVCEEDYV